MKKFNVLLVGAGQLGSRHLQALAMSELKISISVVDPFEDALKLAKTRFDEVGSSNNILDLKFEKDLNNISQNIDLCIIATSADCRLHILKELVHKVSLANIIFEKVLFQSEEQIIVASNLLEKYEISAWVNCPRRMQPIYHKLHELLSAESNIEINVVGNNWGLACNSIHMIDLWSYLTDKITYELDMSGLEPRVLNSKRPNFKELEGRIIGTSPNSKFVLDCRVNEKEPSVKIFIKSKNYEVSVDEMKGICQIIDLRDNQLKVENFSFLYQSQLTNIALKEILTEGKSDLTQYSDSAALHRPFLNSVLKHINKYSISNYDICPIT